MKTAAESKEIPKNSNSKNSRNSKKVTSLHTTAPPLQQLQVLFKLLSEEVRVRIMCLLRGGELNVSEIQQILTIKQSNLSSHLTQLKEHGFLASRREGQHSYYKLVVNMKSSGALLREVWEAARSEPWYQDDNERRKKIIEERQRNVLKYFQSTQTKDLVAPGQSLDVLAIGFLHRWHGKRVVDLGCGTGQIARLYALAGAKVWGVDLSLRQLVAAKKFDKKTFTSFTSGKKLGLPTYHCENMEATSLSGGAFDLVILSHALHHVSEPRKALREAYRLLKKGGEVLVIDLEHHHNETLGTRFGDFWLGFSLDTFMHWLEEIGFTAIHQQTHYHYVCKEKVFPFTLSAKKT